MKPKKPLVLFLLCLLVCLLPLPTFANSPMPADHLYFCISNKPEEAVYADLLIKIEETDSKYVDFQKSDYGDDPAVIEEITEYSTDGYRSFTVHYKDAVSDVILQQEYDEIWYAYFCKGLEYEEYLTQYEDVCNNYGNIKIALLNEKYEIIAVSDAVQLPKTSSWTRFYGCVEYDAGENSIYVETYPNPFVKIFYGLFSIIIMLTSISVETLFAFFWFKFKGKQTLIAFIVNLCSQSVMRFLYVLLPFTYLIETVVLEILVYSVEFLIYKKTFKHCTTVRILTYTIVANTISLLLGILLDCVILPL